jgi:hypothetical protein
VLIFIAEEKNLAEMSFRVRLDHGHVAGRALARDCSDDLAAGGRLTCAVRRD